MREIFIFILSAVMFPLTAAVPVFEFTARNGAPHASGKDGRPIEPLLCEKIAILKDQGLRYDAFKADSGVLLYPGNVLPPDRGTVEAWVAPLPSGCTPQFHFFTGDADEWGPEGLPRLWFWEGRPRFDVDPGPRLIAEWLKTPSWKPGVWHHLVATYDKKGMVELYVNGELLTRKAVPSWKPVSPRAVAIGSGRTLGNKGRHYADALIDSVRFYEKVLSPEEIARNFRQVKMSQLSISSVGHTVLADTADSLQVRIRNTGNADFAGVLKTGFGKNKTADQRKLKIAAGKEVILRIAGPVAVDSQGTARLTLQWSEGPRGKTERSETLEYFSPRSLPEQTVSAPEWQHVKTIDAFRETPVSAVGSASACEKGALRYREGGSKTHNRFAYVIKLPSKDRLLRVRVQYPDDRKRIIMISQSQPDFVHPRTCGTEQQVLGSGVLCGGEFRNTGKMLDYEYIFRHPSNWIALIFETYAENQPPAVGKISVDIAKEPSRTGPAATPPVLQAEKHRRSGLYWEDPVLAPCFGGSGGTEYAEFDNRLRNAMDYFDFTGQKLMLYPTVWYSGPLYRSTAEPGSWPVGMRHHPPEFPRLIAKRCAERGIRFIATFNLWKLPSLASLQASPEEVIAGRDAVNTVARTGRVITSTDWQNPPHLNALRGEVQNAVEHLVDEHLAMYGDSPAFGGIAFALWMGVPMQLGIRLETGYDDWSMREFSVFRKEKLPGKEKTAERFKQRADWILNSEERRTAFQKWRADRITAFYKQIAEKIRRTNPEAELRLILVYPVPLRDSGKTADRLYEQGLDLKKLSSCPGIRLDRMVNQTNLRQEQKWHAEKDLPPHGLELSKAFQAPLLPPVCSGAVVHQQYFETHGPLTRKNDPKLSLPAPWNKEALGRCTAPVPAGRNFLEYYANLLALLDTQELTIGGFTPGLHGVETMAREWTASFQALPSEPFTETEECGSVLLRSTEAEGFRWYYLLNNSGAPISVRLSVHGTGFHTVSGEKIESGTLKLRAYDLLAFRMEKDGKIKLGKN